MLVVYEFSCVFCGAETESLKRLDGCPECGFPLRLEGSHGA